MRKVVWASVVILIIGFVLWSTDPLNDSVNFIIAGSIPGTKLALGLWPSLAIALSAVITVWRGVRRAKLQMLTSTAQQIKNEFLQADFADKHSGQFDKSQRSVIAAPSSDLVI